MVNLKFETIEVDPSAPFDNDQLNRKHEIENLSNLLLNVNTPTVLAINSPWGTGKTTFIRMWEEYLKSEGIQSLYFNAWATDFSEDPLVSFLGEMNDGLNNLIGSSGPASEAWTRTKAFGTQIAKRGLPALIKIGTGGLIDAEKIIEEELSKAMESLTGDALDNYLQQKSAIASFHESLTKLIELSAENKPVVIFVDELDRCRPTYAISLLERIKHLFDIQGMVFVLSIAKTQLAHSIGAVYGEGIDAVSYLKRFIDFEYNLRTPEVSQYIESLFKALSLDEYFEKRKKYPELQYDGEHLKKVFIMLAECHELSLREIEQLLAATNLALRTARENEYVFPALLAFLVVTKNRYPDLYQRYVSNSNSETEMIEHLYEIVPEKGRNENFSCALIEGLLIAAKSDRFQRVESTALTKHKEILNSGNATNDSAHYSENVIHITERPNGSRSNVDLEILISRIEMLRQFKFEAQGEIIGP